MSTPCVNPPTADQGLDSRLDAATSERTGLPSTSHIDENGNRRATVKGNRSVVNASAWSVFGYAISQAMRLANNMFLSYLLVPEAFGTMAIINIVIIGLGMFCEVGVGPCIIQNDRGDEPGFLNTAWSIQVARGFAITLCSVGLAWPVANFYQEMSLIWLIPVAALTSLINGFCSTSVFTLQRHLDLKSLALLEIKSQLVGSVSMCGIAWFYPSVWALVAGSIAAAVAKVVLSHRMIPDYANWFRWDATDARELYRFGKWIFISTVLTFGAMQIDRMMLGKLFDIRVLGIYSFAFAIATMPRLLVEKLVGSILYPVLAQAKRESVAAMASKLVSARSVLLAVGAASVISIVAWSQLFFQTLYHADFHAAGTICQMICAVSWVSVMSLSLSRALIALGNTRSLATFNFVNLVGMICGGLTGNYVGGLNGFIVGLVLGVLCGHVAITLSLAKHSVLLVRQDFGWTLVLGCAAALVIWAQRAGVVPFGGQLALFAAISGGFWVWAVQEIRVFRSMD